MNRFVPTFGPRRKPLEHEVLYQSRSCLVYRAGGVVRMNAEGKWSRSMAAQASRFRIDRLLVSAACAKGGLEFLEDLPGLRQLSVSIPDQTLDWRPVEQLKHLQDLALSSAPIVRTAPPGEIDLTALPALNVCELSKFHPQWDSVFRCTKLRGLHLTTSRDLKDTLDVTAMPKLTELVLGGLPKLTSLRLAERARVQSMQLRTCRKLQVDWTRVGRDLRYLWVEGKTAWPLEDLRHAAKLERLMISHRGRIESAAFLKDLPRLKWLDLFLAEFTPDGNALVNSLTRLQASGPGIGSASTGLTALAGMTC